MRKSWVYAFAASLLLATSAAARIHTATVVGVVTDAAGRAVAGASVVLERSDGTHPRGVRTDAEGRYTFTLLPGGLYDIRASHGSAASQWRHNVMIHAGRKTELNLRLERAKSAKIPASLRKN